MESQLTFEQKYDIIVAKDTSYEGIFYTAVKTTGIFCRPSCTARKPKIENVLFYDSTHEAIVNGFRPCKVCKPIAQAEETPDYIQSILDELNEHPFKKIKDGDLRDRGIAPSKIRRWFKKHHQLTFHGYQRMLRINSAYTRITQGQPITSAAFGSGFESLSGFNSSYQNVFGSSPTQTQKGVINIIRLSTPLGPMFGCATAKGVCLVEFTDRKMLETEFKQLTHRLGMVILPGMNEHLRQLKRELEEYFDGSRKAFAVALDTPGTEFQKAVWTILRQIPHGETRSYQEQALALGKPNAVRAVASANGMNRISIIIPCHRVIGKDGQLTGYGGGLERKRWLLNFEQKKPQESQALLFS